MNKTSILEKGKTIFRMIKPWIITLGILVVLRYTGLLSGLSVLTNTALINTGMMDASPEPPSEAASIFDYDFSIKDMEGNEVDVTRFKGKVIFINLWATWCGPCRAEMPSIEALYQSMDHSQVEFIMLSLDKPDQTDKVKNYIAKKEFSFPVYMIHDGLPELLQVPSIPTTFIISKDGKIESKKVGTAKYNTEKFKQFLNDLATKEIVNE